ncbi:MAG TPA: hypothetical protein VF039_14035 [Longimicrobiales bacterium]
MASRMKWALVAAGFTAALTLALDRGGPPDRRLEEFATQAHLWRTSNELAATRRAIVQWSTLDSVRALLPDSGVGFDAPGAMDASNAILAEARDSIQRELAAQGGSRARILLLAKTQSEETRTQQRGGMSVQYFAGSDDAGGWCAVVIDPHGENQATLREAVFAGGSALGPCDYWARFGAPGPAVRAQLPAWGLFLGAPRTGGTTKGGPARRLFGMRQWGSVLAPYVDAQACVAGRLDACERALLDPSVWTTSFFGTLRSPDDVALLARARYERDAAPAEHLMADLRNEVGDEAFARFWHSDGDLRAALAAATGTPAASWMHRWAVARFGTEPRGPTLDLLTAVLTLLALAALGAASLHVAQRRRVA